MNMLNEIYNISVQEAKPTEEELRLGEVIINLHEELKDVLPEEKRSKLFDMSDTYAEREALAAQEAYRRGFRDAIQLIASVH